MKVLKNNYNEAELVDEAKQLNPYPRQTICEECRSELEYEESDLRIGVYGCVFLDCPVCKYDNMLEDNEKTITLTMDNIEFPTHFHHTSKENGAVDCCNNGEIRKNIRTAIDYFRKNKNEYSWYTSYGNLYIHVDRYEGDESYEVTVSKDYYSTTIPFETEDYRR